MLFYFDSSGNLLKSVPGNVYQGSNNASKVYVTIPLPTSVTATANIKLPNGVYLKPQLVSNGAIPNTSINGELNFALWSLELEKTMTAYAGDMEIQFTFYPPNMDKITTANIIIPILKGNPTVLPEEPTEDIYEQILAVLSQIYGEFSVFNDTKQNKTDDTLKTESKEIVGAINEVDANLKNLNIKNGQGGGSVVQKQSTKEGESYVTGSDGTSPVADSKAPGASAVSLNVRNNANGDASIAGNYSSTANTKGDTAFNTSTAGPTKAEFNKLYPNGYDLNGEKLNYEQYKKRVINCAFACNHGRSKGKDTFSAGTHDTNHGSKAPNSATFGFWCITEYGTIQVYDDNGHLKYEYIADGSNSLCGGKYSTCHNPNSITYGDGLTAPKRDFPTAIFGRNNKNWHDDEGVETYKTIVEVGNGTGQSYRSNAMVVTDDGRIKGFGKPKDKNDCIRFEELYERVPTPPHYTNSDIGIYTFKAVVETIGDKPNITYKWVKG